MGSKHIYCPYCGKLQYEKGAYRCTKCEKVSLMLESKYNSEYYIEQSEKQFGDSSHWRDILMEEIKENPKFNERLSQKTDTYLPASNIISNKPNTQNISRCPTCQSTDIKKISFGSKVAGAAVWGLLSTTARSQFQCNNCGYKW